MLYIIMIGKMKNDRIVVSVWCIAYNHEKYIERAIKSFVDQKTDFEYEIIIHDDASTDNTAKIIKKYQEKYPNLIKMVVQKENQYSQGREIFEQFLYPITKGRYIALCEGDDYWIDEYKLQKQVDYMEKNDKCTLCFHNAVVVNTKNEIIKGSFLPKNDLFKHYFDPDKEIYTTEDIIKLDFMPTNSMVFRYENIEKCFEFEKMRDRVCGDMIFRLYMVSCGYAYYINEKMSAYRKGVEGSASQRAQCDDYSILHKFNGHFEILDDFDKITDYKFHDSIQVVKINKLYEYYREISSLRVFENSSLKAIYKQEGLKYKISYRIKRISVVFHGIIRKVLFSR